MKIIGTNIYLRPTRISDAIKSLEWLNKNDIVRNGLGIERQATLSERKKFILDRLRDSSEKTFSIMIRKSGDYIGNIYIYNFNYPERKCELGIFIGEQKYMEKGFGSEAIKLIEQYASEKIGIKTIYLKTFIDNKIALKFYRKHNYMEIVRTKNVITLQKKLSIKPDSQT